MGLGVDRLTVFRFPPPLRMTQTQFYDFCQIYPEIKMELNAKGEVELLPSGLNSGKRNVRIVRQLDEWAERHDAGDVIGPDTGVNLSNGATRAPDAAFLSTQQLAAIDAGGREDRFVPVCPIFVVEVRSSSDRLKQQTAKMDEYIENGAQLAWLIDPQTRRVHVYRPGQPPVILDQPESVDASPELPGFVLDLKRIW